MMHSRKQVSWHVGLHLREHTHAYEWVVMPWKWVFPGYYRCDAVSVSPHKRLRAGLILWRTVTSTFSWICFVPKIM